MILQHLNVKFLTSYPHLLKLEDYFQSFLFVYVPDSKIAFINSVTA